MLSWLQNEEVVEFDSKKGERGRACVQGGRRSQEATCVGSMGKLSFVAGALVRLVAVGAVFYAAAIPLLLFVARAHEGLYEEPYVFSAS
jgi:hypothetical protein